VSALGCDRVGGKSVFVVDTQSALGSLGLFMVSMGEEMPVNAGSRSVFCMGKIACGYTCVVDVLEISKGEGSIFVAAKQTKQCKVTS